MSAVQLGQAEERTWVMQQDIGKNWWGDGVSRAGIGEVLELVSLHAAAVEEGSEVVQEADGGRR